MSFTADELSGGRVTVGEQGRDAPRAVSDENEPRRAAGPVPDADMARVAIATACSILAVFFMNRCMFPRFDETFTCARDISITVEALTLIALAVAAMWKPSSVKGRLIDAAAVALIVIGAPVLWAGLALHSPVLLVIGACLVVTARGWAAVLVSMAAVALPVKRMVASVLAGTMLATLVETVAAGLPEDVGIALSVVVLPLAVLALCHGPAEGLMDEIASSSPVAEISVTRPASFLPLTHTLYVFQFVMFIGFGFALRFGEVGGTPSFGTAVSALALLALIAVVVARGGGLPFDGLCNVSVLLLLAGFIFAIAGVGGGTYWANSLLVVGNSLYNTLIMCTLVALAGRNRVTALSIFGWASGLAALGTTLGALVGTTVNALVATDSHDAVTLVVATVVLLLMGYVLFFVRGFSFTAAIAEVEAPDPAPREVQANEEAFELGCAAIAREYGLTPREEETFAMLARGRNREYIENALTVSRNTVKAHVKHIYAKLGIHSHQELLDLVEQQLRGR